MSIELHVPDLPPLTIGGATGGRRRQPWGRRVREALSSYLPVLLMALLALSTWWLVQNTPSAPAVTEAAPARHEPDYAMQRFQLQRFGADGRLAVQIEGRELRHYPDTDTLEIDDVQLRATLPDGTVTQASARRAVANGDATEVQLRGGAQVRRGDLAFEGEFLHAFLETERLRSHLPVRVRQGGADIRAGGFEYDHLNRVVRFTGPVRAVLPRRG